MVQLADVVEHRPARGDGVGHPGDPVGGDVLEKVGAAAILMLSRLLVAK